MADVLIDANVFLRASQTHSPQYAAAVRSLEALLDGTDTPIIVPQVCYEFWVVATRPVGINGLGLSIDDAGYLFDRMRKSYELRRDTPEVYDRWLDLVLTHNVRGKPAHDARLVAAAQVHGVRRLLTFNVRDFARYDLKVESP